MNTTIKKRIEEINCGRVPEGYKMTLVGIAPEEWKENVLADFFEFKNGLNKEKSAFGQGTPIINYTDVWGKRGLYSKDIKGKVSLSKKEIENYGVKKGDVFFTRTSETKQEIGLSSVLLEDVENCVFSGFVLRARPKNMEIIDAYNQYCYSSELMRYEIIKNSSITTRALTNGTLLGKVHINLPTIKEQSRIAEILMQWDKAIELQEKYIKQLELRKKALMQRLLTPKEGWTCKPLGYYFYKEKGKNVAISVEGKKPIIDMDYAINNRAINFSNDLSGVFALDNEIIILWDGASAGKVLYGIKGIVGSTFCVLRQVNKVNSKYVYFYLDYAYEKNKKTREGSGIPHMPKDFLKKQAIWSPENILEQNKIANILTQADNEISLQTQKLDNLIKQRKALQQYLLTGIVRV